MGGGSAAAPWAAGWVDERTVAHGWWGPATADTDWCEPNYLWTHYIAEFWNTLSSIPIATFALHGIWAGDLLGSVFLVAHGTERTLKFNFPVTLN